MRITTILRAKGPPPKLTKKKTKLSEFKKFVKEHRTEVTLEKLRRANEELYGLRVELKEQLTAIERHLKTLDYLTAPALRPPSSPPGPAIAPAPETAAPPLPSTPSAISTQLLALDPAAYYGPRKHGKYRKGDFIFCGACGQGLLPAEAHKHRSSECTVMNWKRFERVERAESRVEPSPDSSVKASSSSSTSEPASSAEGPVGQETSSLAEDDDAAAAVAAVRLSESAAATESTIREQQQRNDASKRTCRYCNHVFETRRAMWDVFIRNNCKPNHVCSDPVKFRLPAEMFRQLEVLAKQKGDGAAPAETLREMIEVYQKKLEAQQRQEKVPVTDQDGVVVNREVEVEEEEEDGEDVDLLAKLKIPAEIKVETETEIQTGTKPITEKDGTVVQNDAQQDADTPANLEAPTETVAETITVEEDTVKENREGEENADPSASSTDTKAEAAMEEGVKGDETRKWMEQFK